jgi:sugar phosphate isomerase/epimerase
MKSFFLSLPLWFTLAASASALDLHGDFKGPAGLQLYSLRETIKVDPVQALDRAKTHGFTSVELYSSLPLEPAALKTLLAERGMTAVSGHFGYDALKKDLAGSVQKAQDLGLKFAGVAWIPHEIGKFGEADVKRAAADFQEFGAAFKAAGIQFFYHTHGYEFRPVELGKPETWFDRLAAATDPALVAFEMDVFWVVHPGADPVALLAKYPNRWALMHLKDIRKGAVTGIYLGSAPLTDDVPLGTGQVNWPAVLKQAAASGVKHYFIEDESPTVLEALPISTKYLEGLTF